MVQLHVHLSLRQLEFDPLHIPRGFDPKNASVQLSILHVGIAHAAFAPVVPGAGAYQLSSLPQSLYDRRAGETETGLCWPATRSRNSRPELIPDNEGARGFRRVLPLASRPPTGDSGPAC